MRWWGLAFTIVVSVACPVAEPGEGEGESVCAGLVIRCDAGCVDVQSDEDNCGVCGNVCADDEACTGGRCNARCRNPRLDTEGELVGVFPELAGCTAARYDVDRDGVIDSMCGGFRITTEPAFAISLVGTVDNFNLKGGADLSPEPGLERISGVEIRNLNAVVASVPGGGLAGNGLSDVDDDGDFDIVYEDGRVMLQTVAGLVEGPPVPAPPGAIARFPIVDASGDSEFVSFANNQVLRFVGDSWVNAGNFAFEALALYTVGDAGRVLVLDDARSREPSLSICVLDGARFRCRLASINAGIVASPPRDGGFVAQAPGFIDAAGGERNAGVSSGPSLWARMTPGYSKSRQARFDATPCVRRRLFP